MRRRRLHPVLMVVAGLFLLAAKDHNTSAAGVVLICAGALPLASRQLR